MKALYLWYELFMVLYALWSRCFYFVSLDGQEVFWLTRSPENNYSWKEASQDMEMRTIIKEALKVAEGKTTPKIVPIPVYLKRGELK